MPAPRAPLNAWQAPGRGRTGGLQTDTGGMCRTIPAAGGDDYRSVGYYGLRSFVFVPPSDGDDVP
ncbi:hypothetical protein GCM10027273_41010 [Nocardioides pakistanensis]